MSVPNTTAGLKQIQDLNNLAREFNFYARGTKQIADARAFKSQFSALRNGISTVRKTADTATTTAKNASAIATNAKKITDLLQQGAFKKINPSWGARFSNFLAILNAGATTFIVKKNEEIQEANIATQEYNESQIQKNFDLGLKNTLEIRAIQKQNEGFKKFQNDITYEVRQGRKIVEAKAVEAKKQANDALYEARKGREVLETKITEAKKLGNDALYEVRQGRVKLENKITSDITALKSNFDSLNTQLKSRFDTTLNNFKSSTNATIDSLKQQLSGTNKEVSSINQRLKNPEKIDTNSIASKAANIVFNQVNPKLSQINQDSYGQNTKINTVVNGLSALGGQLKSINNRIDLIEKTPIKLPPQRNYDAQIEQINARLKEQENVNNSALPKLDSILALIPLIPARAAGLITPSIPTISQIETAAATGTCRTTQPGGCSRKMMDDAVNRINNNANQNKSNILDALNTGANAAQLGLLKVIDAKLGAQLPGGLSGTFGRLWQTLQIDRIINTLTLITTMHNAAMLSRNVGETLFSAFDNISQMIGFKWKNEKGEDVGFGGLVSQWTTNFFKGIFGETTYNNINKTWNSFNRTYQATTNMFYQVQGMFDSARSLAELTADNTGKIGNALKKAGAIFENAFPDMSEHTTAKTAYQKKWDDIIEGINELDDKVSAFSSITGEMVSIGENFNELKNQRDEFFKAKDDSEKAVTALINGEKEAAKVNQDVTKQDTQKSED